MSEASSTDSRGQKRSSQKIVEGDETANARGDASSSVKKAKAVKLLSQDEFVSDDEDDVSVGEEEEEEKKSEGPSERQKKAAEECKSITKMWVDEEPDVNVERPFPSNSDRSDFCWYDLTEEWRADRSPEPVPVDNVDRRFKYGASKFYVNLPFAENQNNPSQGTSIRPRGELIFECIRSFSNGVRSLDHLEAGVRTYWKNFRPVAFKKMFKDQSEDVCNNYLEQLTNIAKIALKSTLLVTKPLPTLVAGGDVKSVSMSQEQAACLLAYSFFCTVLPRNKEHFNHFSFHKFHLNDSPIYIEKMKFILHYFKTVSEEMPRGTLTYSRQAWDFRQDERLGYDTWKEPLSQCVVMSKGLIEEMEGCLQVDFANEFIGGGVMNTGAVQEEIRFLCCPEMLVSMLLCDVMGSDEAILIQGAQQYSTYEGYSRSLKHVPLTLARDEPRDRFGRARSYLVAIDAIQYQRGATQYEMRFITREIKKAYAGFMIIDGEVPARPIATGNWGCGVFNGDKELKSLIQLIAASKASRPMIYASWNDEQFAEELEHIVGVLKKYEVDNGWLFSLLINYGREKEPKERVFEYIQRVLSSHV